MNAIGFLNDQKIVDRDINLKNILINKYGNAKIFKFDHAIMTTEKLREKIGNVENMAPEMLRGKKYGPEVDIWQAGICLYTMLCGKPPFYESK
jgi:serine/threonine protein kinase